MRHARRKGKLDRTTGERKSLFRSLVLGLMKGQRITTTVAKAKEARRLAEKVITLGKKADIPSRRRLLSILLDRSLVKEIVNEIAPRFKNRQGGYTRIIRLSKYRKGDNAELVLLELTEQKVSAPPSKKAKKGKKPEEIKKETQPKEEAPKPPKEEKHPPYKEERHPPKKEEFHPPPEKTKKGFFQNLKKFLRPKTGTGS